MSNASAYSYSEQDSRDPLVESAMPPDPKTKIRPQQSCLKCRERKVKVRFASCGRLYIVPNISQCDRSIPCHACVIRGLAAECTYTATAEDRAHISQADVIERLRCEVSQLRGRLNQPREQGQRPSQPKTYRQHPYASAGHRRKAEDGLGDREGSWCGSSPSPSVTMRTSATVTSPDSTGSDNEAGSLSSRSVSASASASTPASFSHPAMPPHLAELDRSRSETDPRRGYFYLNSQGCADLCIQKGSSTLKVLPVTCPAECRDQCTERPSQDMTAPRHLRVHTLTALTTRQCQHRITRMNVQCHIISGLVHTGT